jgi:enoyl-CoA hydratase
MIKEYVGRYLRKPETVYFEVTGAVARVGFNRPEKRNALSNQLVEEMRDALLEADAREDVHAVVLEGAGKDFCAGYDLITAYERYDEGQEPDESIPYRASAGSFDNDCWNMERFQSLPNVIYDMHKPVIAKVQGNCLAGGTDIALRCDMVIAAEDAKIGFPATRANGSPPAHMWTYHCGPQWAKRLLMTGDTIRGIDAARIGLVMEAVPADELDDYVMNLAARVALIDPELNAAHKRIVNLALEQMGMMNLQRMAIEMDARAHLSTGPRRSGFKADMKEHGMKEALRNRDEPFGRDPIELRALGRD